MLSILAVVLVAVLGASVVLVTGIAFVLSILRRRDRKLMLRHGVHGNLAAYHRPRLSATENNYAHIPPPKAALRRSARPDSIPVIWSTGTSEEHILPDDNPSSHPESDLAPPNAKRRKSFRVSFYGHSFQGSKKNRQKKVQKNLPMRQLRRSPLSAITEFTDSADGPAVAELAAEHTPRDTPERLDDPRSSIQWPMPVAKIRGERNQPLQRQSSVNGAPPFTRSVSMGSNASNAPDDPLPPLPNFDLYKHHRSQGWRASTTSIDTTGSSVLGTVMSSPLHAETDLTIPSLNSEMQTFDFGFQDGRSTARLGAPPGRQTLTGYCTGKPGINSIRPSFDYQAGRSVSAGSARQGSLQTIDARNWNPSLDCGFRFGSRSTSNARHSLQDYGSILGKRGQYNELADQIERASPPTRPASVASSTPYQWDMRPRFSTVRHSAGSADGSKRGHRRQNCVRITNLPPVEVRNSKVEQMPELAEEQSETLNTTQVKIPGLSLLDAGQPILRARASLVDIRGSPSPLQNRPILLPTNRPKRPIFYRTSTSSSGFPRPDSDIFNTAQPSPTTPTIFQSTRQLPLSPTPYTSIKVNSNTPPPHDSPILPSPIHANQPRRSLVKGPRNQSDSSRSSRTGSPVHPSQKYSQRKTPDDLRKSVMVLRSMNSEGRLLDPSSRNYRNIGTTEDITSSTYPTMNNLALFPTTDRRPSTTFGPSRSKMSIAMSPSAMSMGAPSIWEDVSVRADSPEPDLPTPKTEVMGPPPRTPQMKIPFPDPEAYENMVNHSKAFKDRKYASPQGKGLGIVGPEGRILGTPAGSLYDGDGFLKD